MSTSSSHIRLMAEISLAAALAMALSFIPSQINWFEISLGQGIILWLSIRRGLIPGIVAGLLWGTLHFVLGKVYFLSLPQVLIEYLLAFASIGLAGMAKRLNLLTLNKRILIATFIGTVARYFWHFLAGVIFWGDYAFKGWGPVTYSLVINGVSGLLTGFVAYLFLTILAKQFPKLFD